MPYDCGIYLDSDTLVKGTIEELLEWTQQYQFVVTWFSDWLTCGPPVRRRIEEWSKVDATLMQPAIAYGKAINSGVQGWTKHADLLPAYEALTRRGELAGCNRIVLDEIALQLLLPHYKHHLAASIWNASGSFGDVQGARIVHYHGNKHCRRNDRCELWKQHYLELQLTYPELVRELRQSWGDRRLRRFIRRRAGKRSDTALETACGLAPKK
jgi:hypothetical protein